MLRVWGVRAGWGSPDPVCGSHVGEPSQLWREWGLASLGISSLRLCPERWQICPTGMRMGHPSALGLASEPCDPVTG